VKIPRVSRWVALLAMLSMTTSVWAQSQEETENPGRTPPRLSFVDGEVSFWRAGAEDWSPAQVNTPLGEGDQLYAGGKANLEIQIGARAFVRGGEDTQLGISNLDPDFLQLRVVSGHVSLDLRTVKSGMTIEVDTPHAAFTIENAGYYRVEVSDQNTSFTTRRGGRASVTPASGEPAAVASSEQVILSGEAPVQLASYAAPELDDWDRWNYTRTDQQLDAVSSRYVPYGVYGVDDLDHYGDWRVVPTYGSVWMPRVASGWAPYSTGAWVADPYYGWTWVDAAPWGWAPFHYGRWVQVGGYWGWAPGPLVARPYYAPALVAFFDVPSFAFGVSFGHAATSWVALGWGEPCSPWWGPSQWRGHANWMGWGGPRVVNNVVVNNTTIVNVNQVNHWSNAEHRGAVVGVSSDKFGRGRIQTQHFDPDKIAKFRPVRGELDQKPTTASLAPSTQRGQRPPQDQLGRQVVATREPTREPNRERFGRSGQTHAPAAQTAAPSAAHIVPPQRHGADPFQNRPPFGQSSTVRSAPPEPPRYGESRGREQTDRTEAVPASPAPPAASPHARPAPREASRPDHFGAARPPAPERSRPQIQTPPRELPGEPASHVFQRPERAPQQPRSEPPRAEQPRAEHPHGGHSQRREQPESTADPRGHH
jgi:hypothetical protein